MIVTLPRADLVAALALLSRVADKRSAMPILSHVCLTASGGSELTLDATDLILSARTTLTAQVTRQGSVCLPAALLASQVAALPDGEVTLSADLKTYAAVLSAGKRRVNFAGLPGEDFPRMADLGERLCTIHAHTLATALRRVEHCVLNYQTRPHLESVHLMAQGDALLAEATNGNTMARTTLAAPGVGTWTCLVHRESLATICGVLDALGETGTVDLGARRDGASIVALSLAGSGRRVATKTTDATYPTMDNIFAEHSGTEGRCRVTPAAPLTKVVSAARGVARGELPGVVLSVSDGALLVRAEGNGLEEFRDEVAATVEGDNMGVVAVQIEYLSGALRAASAPMTLSWPRGACDRDGRWRQGALVVRGQDPGVDIIMPKHPGRFEPETKKGKK